MIKTLSVLRLGSYFLSFSADENTACAAVGGLLKERQNWNVAQCEIVCCNGDKCNTQNPTLPSYPAGRGGVCTVFVLFYEPVI